MRIITGEEIQGTDVKYYCFNKDQIVPRTQNNFRQSLPYPYAPTTNDDIEDDVEDDVGDDVICINRNSTLPKSGFYLLDSKTPEKYGERLTEYDNGNGIFFGARSTSVNYNSDDSQTYYFMVIFIVGLLVMSLLNIIINYFTLRQCLSVRPPTYKWYHFFALNQAASLRYTFNTLRYENELLYEQIYLLIKHLKNSDNKHIIVINRNAIETEAKYDYARFSGYMHLKTPLYEAPFDSKKCIVEDEVTM